MIAQRPATSVACCRPDLRRCRHGCPRHRAFFGAVVAFGEQQVEASLAGIAADHVHFVEREHFKVVDFDRAAVRAGKAEARSFRRFVKVHGYLAFTNNARDTGSTPAQI